MAASRIGGIRVCNGSDAVLPPPITESAEDLARRDNAAIAQIAALVPVNAAEANVAAEFVAANAHAMDCLREARDPATVPTATLQCRAQAISMMRQAQSALRLLLRLQAVRLKRDANPADADRAAWTEHCAVGFMARPLSGGPPAATSRCHVGHD